MKLIMIRHFATQGNLEKRYVGSTDESILPKEGWNQEENAAVLAAKKQLLEQGLGNPELIFVSPLKRCRESVAIWFPEREVQIEEGLRETSFGEFEYKNYQELTGNPAYQRWIDSEGKMGFPGGESMEEFKSRCLDTLDSCIRMAKQQNATTLALVTHGGVIMTILQFYCQQDFYEGHLPCGGVRVIDIGE